MKAVGAVAAPEILANRILWSLLLLLGLIAATRRWAPVAALLRAPKTLAVLALTALLIGINWLVYIWAVNAGFVLETSLGYFVTPLVNVLLGIFVLRERLRPAQTGAVALAAIGVALLAFAQGGLPWISLVLAFSFSFYGLLRKIAPVDPLTGLLAETALLAPMALRLRRRLRRPSLRQRRLARPAARAQRLGHGGAAADVRGLDQAAALRHRRPAPVCRPDHPVPARRPALPRAADRRPHRHLRSDLGRPDRLRHRLLAAARRADEPTRSA